MTASSRVPLAPVRRLRCRECAGHRCCTTSLQPRTATCQAWTRLVVRQNRELLGQESGQTVSERSCASCSGGHAPLNSRARKTLEVTEARDLSSVMAIWRSAGSESDGSRRLRLRAQPSTGSTLVPRWRALDRMCSTGVETTPDRERTANSAASVRPEAPQ